MMGTDDRKVLRCIAGAVGILFLLSSGGVTAPQRAPTLAVYNRLHPNWPGAQRRMSVSAEWQSFTADQGSWTVVWNPVTLTPHRAWGRPLPVPGFSRTTAENAEIIARRFLNSRPELFPPTDLELVRMKEITGAWSLIFQQTVDGIPLHGALTHVRISDDARVVLFGCDAHRDPQVDPGGWLSSAEAIRQASAGPDGVGRIVNASVSKDRPQCILPLLSEDGIRYHMAWRVEITMEDPPSTSLIFIDARSGGVLQRRDGPDGRVLAKRPGGSNRSANDLPAGEPGAARSGEDMAGRVHGDILPLTPFGSYQDRPFSHLTVDVGAQMVETDDQGRFTAALTESCTVQARLSGPYVHIVDASGAESLFEGVCHPGDSLAIEWSDDNSQRSERNAFYHANVAHDYIKAVDPGFTGVDRQITFQVNDTSDECNGYWGGDIIYLYAAGGGCENYAEIADVIVHEYGHAIMGALYGAYYPGGAIAEGVCDYFAATVTDQPLMGAGAYGPGTYGRSVDNDLIYPDDLNGEIHHDGLILAGALWDTRQLLGRSLTDSLYHFAMYGLPVTYDDFFLEMLFVDDDDADLTNGTPHWNEIHDAFNDHGIGVALKPVVEHTPLADTPNTVSPYLVVARISETLYPVDPSGLQLFYDVGEGWQTVGLQLMTPPSIWYAHIPQQPEASLVRYYLTAMDSMGYQVFDPPEGGEHPHFFFVGHPVEVFHDEMEEETGWTAGADDDDATSGLWVRADPVGTTLYDEPAQPENDHSISGTICWVTGNATPGAPAGSEDVDDGQTTLISPPLDLSGLISPAISYYRWYCDATNMDDTFSVDISADGGMTWENVETVDRSERAWTLRRLLVEDYVTPSDRVLVRFVAADRGKGSLVEAAVDDFTLLALDTAAVGVPARDETAHPGRFSLLPLYPNPCNPVVNMAYRLPQDGPVTLEIYNILGQRVAVLYRDRWQPAGAHTVTWDAGGRASGVYLCRLRAGRHAAVRRFVVLK